MQQRTLFALCILAIAAVCFAADATADTFNFSDFIKGEWEVEYSTIQGESTKTEKGKYYLEAGVLEGILIGNYTFLSTSEESEDAAAPSNMDLRVETESARQGVFRFLKSSSSDNIDEFNNDQPATAALLELPYKFDTSPSGFVFAQNVYKVGDKVEGIYEFTVPSQNAFIVTLIPTSAQQEGQQAVNIKRIVARKVGAQPGFFARYGPTMMIIGFFMLSKMFTRKYTEPLVQPRQGAAAGAAAATKKQN